MANALLGFIAGLLSPLSPCILPLLPIILVAAVNVHRYGPLALIGGLLTAFTMVGLLLSGAVWALQISDDAVRLTSASMLIVFGLIVTSGTLGARFAAVSTPL